MKINNDSINKEINKAEKQMLLDKYTTAMNKAKFINELKGELGEDIKKNPGKAHIIKKSWVQKLMLKIKVIFTTF